MKSRTLVLIAIAFICNTVHAVDQSLEDEEIQAEAYLAELNDELNQRRHDGAIASWKYESNITDHNERVKNDVTIINAEFFKNVSEQIRKFHFESYKNENLKRQLKLLSKLGYEALSPEKFKELTDTLNAMESNYAKVRVCDYRDKTKCDLQLEPEITETLTNSCDPDELKYYWEEWHQKAGAPIKANFEKYVQITNEAAQLNNFTSQAEAWLDEYEDSTMEYQVANILEEIRPLYEQLHAYVRHSMIKKYGAVAGLTEDDAIPIHLTGNMWGQTWEWACGLEKPFPAKSSTNVTEEMLKQNYTANHLFRLGDEFFQSLNMTKLPESFWTNSILEKPDDGRDLICHASAWDFYLNSDVRIKQCSRINVEDLGTAHHELGHIQYFLQYENQPFIYRTGANPGFHEAVGDVIGLSVLTPKHLHQIGLIKEFQSDNEAKLNNLFEKALEKVVILPFALTIDQYRWAIFRGQIKPENYNCGYWKLRLQNTGLRPPNKAPKKDGFDAGAKYHVSADVEYLRYAISTVLQFQIQKSLCIKAGEYEPGNPDKTLADCDIYNSAAAGNALKEMLALGASKTWPEALQTLTGQSKMSASALLEYFKPLQDWLEETNKKNNAKIGWPKSFSSDENETLCE